MITRYFDLKSLNNIVYFRNKYSSCDGSLCSFCVIETKMTNSYVSTLVVLSGRSVTLHLDRRCTR
jgi:hypothetical protein